MTISQHTVLASLLGVTLAAGCAGPGGYSLKSYFAPEQAQIDSFAADWQRGMVLVNGGGSCADNAAGMHGAGCYQEIERQLESLGARREHFRAPYDIWAGVAYIEESCGRPQLAQQLRDAMAQDIAAQPYLVAASGQPRPPLVVPAPGARAKADLDAGRLKIDCAAVAAPHAELASTARQTAEENAAYARQWKEDHDASGVPDSMPCSVSIQPMASWGRRDGPWRGKGATFKYDIDTRGRTSNISVVSSEVPEDVTQGLREDMEHWVFAPLYVKHKAVSQTGCVSKTKIGED